MNKVHSLHEENKKLVVHALKVLACVALAGAALLGLKCIMTDDFFLLLYILRKMKNVA